MRQGQTLLARLYALSRKRKVELFPFMYVFQTRWFRPSIRERRRNFGIQLQSDSDFVAVYVTVGIQGKKYFGTTFHLAQAYRWAAGSFVPIELKTTSNKSGVTVFNLGFLKNVLVLDITNLEGKLSVTLHGLKVYKL